MHLARAPIVRREAPQNFFIQREALRAIFDGTLRHMSYLISTSRYVMDSYQVGLSEYTSMIVKFEAYQPASYQVRSAMVLGTTSRTKLPSALPTQCR